MEIKEGGFTVTFDVPAIDRIQAEPDGDSLRVVTAGKAFTPDEWREFTDACVYVRDRLAGSAQPVAPSPSGPWARIEDVPTGVDVVFDRDRDRWSRGSGGCWTLDGNDDSEPSKRVNPYSPFSLKR